MLKGYSSPRSPEGRSGIVPPPPWHYVGDVLVIEFWADPAAAAAVLPAPLEPHPDGGRAAAMFFDWQSCSDSGGELVDPSRSQYKEFFVTVNALYEGEEVAFCPYIWVDQDFALARGWIQGFPKQIGSVWITRTFGLDTTADPGLKPGAVFGGTCAAYERRLVLVRPDGHVAWRADEAPAEAGALIDVVRGQGNEVQQQKLGRNT